MEKSSIKNNFLYNAVSKYLLLLIPFVTTPYISRILGADGIGQYSYLYSIVSYFVLFAVLGIQDYGQREIAMVQYDSFKRNQIFWELTVLRSLITTIVLLIYFIFIQFHSQDKIFYYILSFNIVANFFDFTWFFQGMELFKITVLRNVVIKFGTLILIFALIKTKQDLLLYFFLMSFSVLIGNLSYILSLRHLIKRPQIECKNLLYHLKKTIVYFIPTIAVSIYQILDKTMLGLLTGNMFESGYYEQANKMIQMILTLIYSLNTVMISRVSLLFAQKEFEQIKKHTKYDVQFLAFICFPLSAGINAISSLFVPWFYGPGFERVAEIIKFMSPLVIVIGISNIIGTHYLTPCGLISKSSRALVFGATTNFIANILLIPKMGATGAVIATFVAEITITIIYIIYGYKAMDIARWPGFIWKYLLASIVMYVILLISCDFLNANIVSSIVQVVLGGICYFIVLYLLQEQIVHALLDKIKERLLRMKNTKVSR